jgi:hypothetical protein
MMPEMRKVFFVSAVAQHVIFVAVVNLRTHLCVPQPWHWAALSKYVHYLA